MDVELECDICSQRMNVEDVQQVAVIELLMGQWFATHRHTDEERRIWLESSWAASRDDGEGA